MVSAACNYQITSHVLGFSFPVKNVQLNMII